MDIGQILNLPEKSRYSKLLDNILDLQKSITDLLINDGKSDTDKIKLTERLAEFHVTLSIMVAKGDISSGYLQQATELFLKRLNPSEIENIHSLCRAAGCHLKLVGARVAS